MILEIILKVFEKDIFRFYDKALELVGRIDFSRVNADSLSNLIISEISDQSGNIKRPFSQSIENFIIENKGIHQIKVEQNQSKNPSWQGEFNFEVELKW